MNSSVIVYRDILKQITDLTVINRLHFIEHFLFRLCFTGFISLQRTHTAAKSFGSLFLNKALFYACELNGIFKMRSPNSYSKYIFFS